MIVAERMRQRIAATPITRHDQEFVLTASFGVATIAATESHRETTTAEMILQLADSCLYQAKNSGRNKVISSRVGR